MVVLQSYYLFLQSTLPHFSMGSGSVPVRWSAGVQLLLWWCGSLTAQLTGTGTMWSLNRTFQTWRSSFPGDLSSTNPDLIVDSACSGLGRRMAKSAGSDILCALPLLISHTLTWSRSASHLHCPSVFSPPLLPIVNLLSSTWPVQVRLSWRHRLLANDTWAREVAEEGSLFVLRRLR
jgi:hypothetical protein